MVILFDGKCGLCNASVNWLMNHNPNNLFQFATLQGEFAKTIDFDQIDLTTLDSVVLWSNDVATEKSTAVFQILKKLPFPWKLFLIFSFLPRSFTDFCYDVIAKNRYRWFGQSATCRIPSKQERAFFLE